MHRAVVPCPQEVLEAQECRREDREHLECRLAHPVGKNSRDCNNRCPVLPVEQCLREEGPVCREAVRHHRHLQ